MSTSYLIRASAGVKLFLKYFGMGHTTQVTTIHLLDLVEMYVISSVE
jgi:hypothetical protein